MTAKSTVQTWRESLKKATASDHDGLDARLGALDLADHEDYRRFLEAQYAARAPIEAWCRANCPADLLPPASAALAAADLVSLGFATPRPILPFALPVGADPVGLAWALGGSSLGNRAMLAHLGRKAPADWPVRFLSDTAMTDFWKSLRPRLEQPVDDISAQGAIAAARAVFRHFSVVANGILEKAAA